MDFFTHESNYGFCLTHNSEGSNSSSEGSSSINNPPNAHSDEEVILLASAQPKKRAGRRIFKETRHPVYRGVRLRNKNKWVCEVRVPNNKSRIWLGTYPTPEMAARAHDVAALALRGKSACLNFADSTWRLPLPASNKAEEIRRVAMEAAEAFADTEVCSSGVGVLGEAEPVEVEGTAVSESDELLLRSMVDEPLRSPVSLEINGWDWNEVELDTEVSLWSFTI